MTQELFGVYGAAGHGRDIMPVARQNLAQRGIAADRLVFIDDAPGGAEIVNSQRVMTYVEFLAAPASRRHAALAIADGGIRARLAAKLTGDGVDSFGVSASNVVIMDDVAIGEGALLSPFVTLTSNIRIGRFFHANMYSYVAHDCTIGDFVTFGPAAKCNGNIVIEDYAYVGSGAVIKQGRPGAPLVIGRGAIVGMGAVVTRSVPPGATVVGNPAREMRRPV